MRVLSQAEIDAMLAGLLADATILPNPPSFDNGEGDKKSEAQN